MRTALLHLYEFYHTVQGKNSFALLMNLHLDLVCYYIQEVKQSLSEGGSRAFVSDN